MKRIRVNHILVVCMILFALSCNSEMEELNDDTQNPACTEVPATTEVCNAIWERWFYEEKTKSCNKVKYGGCAPYGFETKEECEECKCN